jgi:hypothetical protein
VRLQLITYGCGNQFDLMSTKLHKANSNLHRGDQVIYKPDHIEDPLAFDYPNGSQPGFIVSGPCRSSAFGPLDCYFVRYWRIVKGRPVNDLRTKANSESTPVRCIVVQDTVPQEWVEKALKDYC